MATDVGIISNGRLVFQDELHRLHERSEHHIAMRTGNNALAAEQVSITGVHFKNVRTLQRALIAYGIDCERKPNRNRIAAVSPTARR